MQPARIPLSGNAVRQAVAHAIDRGVRLLHGRTILVLIILFCVIGVTQARGERIEYPSNRHDGGDSMPKLV